MIRFIFISVATTLLAACATEDGAVLSLSAIPLQDASAGGSTTPPPPDASLPPDSSAEDAGDDGAPAPLACSLVTLAHTMACENCLLDHCTPSCQACEANAHCSAIWTCLNTKCVDDAGVTSGNCANGCVGPYFNDSVALNLVFAFVSTLDKSGGCAVLNCATECPSGP